VRFVDGSVKTPSQDPSRTAPTVDGPGYPAPWLQRIVDETGGRYKVPPGQDPNVVMIEARRYESRVKGV
jgi:hypothetical protein